MILSWINLIYKEKGPIYLYKQSFLYYLFLIDLILLMKCMIIVWLIGQRIWGKASEVISAACIA